MERRLSLHKRHTREIDLAGGWRPSRLHLPNSTEKAPVLRSKRLQLPSSMLTC